MKIRNEIEFKRRCVASTNRASRRLYCSVCVFVIFLISHAADAQVNALKSRNSNGDSPFTYSAPPIIEDPLDPNPSAAPYDDPSYEGLGKDFVVIPPDDPPENYFTMTLNPETSEQGNLSWYDVREGDGFAKDWKRQFEVKFSNVIRKYPMAFLFTVNGELPPFPAPTYTLTGASVVDFIDGIGPNTRESNNIPYSAFAISPLINNESRITLVDILQKHVKKPADSEGPEEYESRWSLSSRLEKVEPVAISSSLLFKLPDGSDVEYGLAVPVSAGGNFQSSKDPQTDKPIFNPSLRAIYLHKPNKMKIRISWTPASAIQLWHTPFKARSNGKTYFGNGKIDNEKEFYEKSGENPVFVEMLESTVATLKWGKGGVEHSIRIFPVDLAADSDDDGDIDQEDRKIRENQPIIIQKKLNKPNTSRTVVIRKMEATGISVKLVKTGNAKLTVKSKKDNAVLLGESQTESNDIASAVSAEDYELTVEGIENGWAKIALLVGDSTIPVDPLPIRVLNADVIFRNGSGLLARLINFNVTHGGFDTGNGSVFDIWGGGIERVSVEHFYSVASTPLRRRVCFRQSNYMAGRIWEKIYDNMYAGKWDIPTGAKPWNLFTTSDNYDTANCLEWLHFQWKRAVREVYLELEDSGQRASFEASYIVGGDVVPLVPPDIVPTISGPVGTAETYIAALVAGANFMGKREINPDVFHNEFEGDIILFYPSFPTTPYDQVPWWVPSSEELNSRGELRTITPKSYFNSQFFDDVPY